MAAPPASRDDEAERGAQQIAAAGLDARDRHEAAQRIGEAPVPAPIDDAGEVHEQIVVEETRSPPRSLVSSRHAIATMLPSSRWKRLRYISSM